MLIDPRELNSVQKRLVWELVADAKGVLTNDFYLEIDEKVWEKFKDMTPGEYWVKK